MPTTGTAISESGGVAGYHWNCNLDDRAFYWTPESGFVTISMPANTAFSKAWGINSAGQVCGEAELFGEGHLGFLYEAGKLTLITPPAGTLVQPYAINERGQVVGAASDGTDSYKAFLWEKGAMQLILPTFGTRSVAYGVNDREPAQIVGWMGTGLGIDSHAFIWDGRMTDLGVPPGAYSAMAFDVNERGDAVGQAYSTNPSGGPFLTRAYEWTGGNAVELPSLPGYERCQALAIDDLGRIVGTCSHPLGGYHAVLWESGAISDLETLVCQDGAFVGLAAAINNVGQIAGSGGFDTLVAALLTPVVVVGDISGDGVVGIIDFLMLLSAWGPCAGCDEDLDGSGDVDGMDLALLFDNWS